MAESKMFLAWHKVECARRSGAVAQVEENVERGMKPRNLRVEGKVDGLMSTHKDPEAIWLQPWCKTCDLHDASDTGRMWCVDNVWDGGDGCPECNRKAVRYVRSSDLTP